MGRAQDLLRGLVAHAVAYKKQAPYNYKCRKLYPALGAPARQKQLLLFFDSDGPGATCMAALDFSCHK